ncbi:MAG: glucose-6-phosphate isomerase [Gracilibacteraceae bacterium]|jgi:glucose-6-phosphate isomerase|nr:glucose-6-phosphate isomerase [Gracilibacteraceae bacterium]
MSWEKYSRLLFYDEGTGLAVDPSQAAWPEGLLRPDRAETRHAWQEMMNLEKGAIANPSEQRMVGHYWLRAPELAPTAALTAEIRETLSRIDKFAAAVHSGAVRGGRGAPFRRVVVVGIGGSSLGPRFVSRALGTGADKMRLYFVDNTDPDGMDRVWAAVKPELAETLTVVISKSGGTVETRNGMEEARLFYEAAGLDFARHAVRITQRGSKLDAAAADWLEFFPMWDWVGGRTSVFSAVGLLPLTLQGIDAAALLRGAAAVDALTRRPAPAENPALLTALVWQALTGGRGGTQMVILPYKDRLDLLAQYAQQLVMESLGKEKDRDGRVVHQGLAVFGNKGSSDQHSYVQQLLAGPDNFFALLIEVLRDREGESPVVGENSTSGDYLQAFLLGTRRALRARGRNSITVTLPAADAPSVGGLIALLERAVGYYASLVNVNAYDQPAVEMGKKSAGEIIALKNDVLAALNRQPERSFTAAALAEAVGRPEETETVFQLLRRLAANGRVEGIGRGLSGEFRAAGGSL